MGYMPNSYLVDVHHFARVQHLLVYHILPTDLHQQACCPPLSLQFECSLDAKRLSSASVETAGILAIVYSRRIADLSALRRRYKLDQVAGCDWYVAQGAAGVQPPLPHRRLASVLFAIQITSGRKEEL